MGLHFRISGFYLLWKETPEAGRRTYRPKRCEYNNKDEDNSPKTLNDKNIDSCFSQVYGQETNHYQLRPEFELGVTDFIFFWR